MYKAAVAFLLAVNLAAIAALGYYAHEAKTEADVAASDAGFARLRVEEVAKAVSLRLGDLEATVPQAKRGSDWLREVCAEMKSMRELAVASTPDFEGLDFAEQIAARIDFACRQHGVRP